MMQTKWKLILGLILIILGIILKTLSDFDQIAVVLIILGAGFKVAHILGIIKNKTYKPGWEIIILILGLMLFFFGLYVCQMEGISKLFIISGLVLKTIFVVLFVKKIKN